MALPVPSTAGNIHNYMNYTDDECMFYFTIQQANRAVCSLMNYRPLLYRQVSEDTIVSTGIREPGPYGYVSQTLLQAGQSLTVGAMPIVRSHETVPLHDLEINVRRRLGDGEYELLATFTSDGLDPAEGTIIAEDTGVYTWAARKNAPDGGPVYAGYAYHSMW